MERKKYLFILILVCSMLQTYASVKEEIYQAYVTTEMTKWKQIIDSMEEVSHSFSDQGLLELINYQYGYIGWCLGTDRKKEAKRYLTLAYTHLKNLEIKGYALSMIYAYKAAFIGYRIGLQPFKAPIIGLESQQYAEKSLELDPDNYFAYIQYGNIQYYKPSIFGGSKSEAVTSYLKGLSLMEESNNLEDNNWNYLNLLAVIIEAKIGMKDYDSAAAYCRKALKKEPDFIWVKNELYPEILEKLKE